MTKKFFLILLSLCVVLTGSTIALSQTNPKKVNDLYSQIELFSYVLTTVQSEYVEPKTPKDLIYGALRGMVDSLDPHSQFMDPQEYKDLKTETEGKFGGLGIEISIRDGLLTVITPLVDTPAWKAGIKAGDRIVKINGKLTKDLTLNDAVKQLRGEPGSKVKITVLREKDFKLYHFTITREIIKIESVKNPVILVDHIGYVRLTEFREDSYKEFHKAVEELKAKGANSLIVDLRNNPGGLLNIAIKISQQFLPDGDVIVSTKGRHASEDSVAYSHHTAENPPINWPMAVLVNGGSASGSEIFSGAMKDNNRAVIIGTQTFGKGTVQSVIPLPDGSGLRLTTAKYYTPSGISIQGTGITPDVVVDYKEPSKKKTDNQEESVEEIFENIKMKESKHPEDLKLTKKERKIHDRLMADNQIQTAINVIKGIRVYRNQIKAMKTGQPTETVQKGQPQKTTK